MFFFIFMICMSVLTPIIFFFCGKLFINNAPKKINYVYGYRTRMSMKNQETWEFAHKYISEFWIQYTPYLAIASVIPYVFVYGASEDTIGILGAVIVFLQLCYIFASIAYTEKALRKHFM